MNLCLYTIRILELYVAMIGIYFAEVLDFCSININLN